MANVEKIEKFLPLIQAAYAKEKATYEAEEKKRINQEVAMRREAQIRLEKKIMNQMTGVQRSMVHYSIQTKNTRLQTNTINISKDPSILAAELEKNNHATICGEIGREYITNIHTRPENLSNLMGRDQTLYFILRDSTRSLQAFAVGGLLKTRGDLPLFYLHIICSKGGGGGAKLMKEIEKLAVRLGCDRIWLSSVPENTTFYHKLGFRFGPFSAKEKRDIADKMEQQPIINPNSNSEKKIFYTKDGQEEVPFYPEIIEKATKDLAKKLGLRMQVESLKHSSLTGFTQKSKGKQIQPDKIFTETMYWKRPKAGRPSKTKPNNTAVKILARKETPPLHMQYMLWGMGSLRFKNMDGSYKNIIHNKKGQYTHEYIHVDSPVDGYLMTKSLL